MADFPNFRRTSIDKVDKATPNTIKSDNSQVVSREHRDEAKWLTFNGKNFSSLKLLYAYVLSLLEDKSDNPEKIDISHLSAGEKEFYNLLNSFSLLLTSLSSTDKSKDITFLNKLSQTWDYILLSTKRREHLKQPCNYLDLLEATIDSIESYGINAGEPLGHYLKTHKQQDWFPLPYLKMLHKLYSNHKEHKEDSTLSHWRDLINCLLLQIRTTK